MVGNVSTVVMGMAGNVNTATCGYVWQWLYRDRAYGSQW